MSDLISVNSNNFKEEVLDSKLIVLVDFGATWCGPCLKLVPVLEQFAKDNAGKVKVVKIDIDDCPELSSSYSIKSVPTLLFFKDGSKVDSKVGMSSLNDLNAMLTKNSV